MEIETIFNDIDFIKEIETETETECIPEPSDIRISTMTATCTLVSNKTEKPTQIDVDLMSIYKNIEIDEINGPIIGISFGELPIRGYDKNKKKKKRKKKTEEKKKKRRKFFNQTTLLIKIRHYVVNLKLFLNGGIQMTGLRDEIEFHKPDQFIPERWENKTIAKQDVVFSVGPQQCPSKRISPIFYKAIIYRLLKNYNYIDVTPKLKSREMYFINPYNIKFSIL